MQKLTSTLLVDDDQTSNYVNNMLLKKLGVSEEVVQVNNGQKALDLLQQCAAPHCPQLILLDIKMPVLDGFGFLEAYQQWESDLKKNIVIVVLTTSLNPRDMTRLEQMPIHAFLNKPLSKAKLQDLLQTHFNLDLPV